MSDNKGEENNNDIFFVNVFVSKPKSADLGFFFERNTKTI